MFDRRDSENGHYPLWQGMEDLIWILLLKWSLQHKILKENNHKTEITSITKLENLITIWPIMAQNFVKTVHLLQNGTISF